MTNHTAIAITQSNGQGSDDFGAAAAVLANLIADFIGSRSADAFIGIVQTVDEGRHDFRVADAIISIAQLAEGGTSLTSIAGGLRCVNQLLQLQGFALQHFVSTAQQLVAGAPQEGAQTIRMRNRSRACKQALRNPPPHNLEPQPEDEQLEAGSSLSPGST